jgi:hypothetical protein
MGRNKDRGLPPRQGGRVCGTPATSFIESGLVKLVL